MARIAKNPKFIRNICTSAHIHHGKCISPDSRLAFEDGTIRTAREIFEEIASNGEIFQDNDEHTIYHYKGKKIFSLNKESGKLELKPIQYAWRLNGGKTIKITLRNGFSITTTPEHKYIEFKNGYNDVEAKNLKIGDRVVCARKTEIDGTNDIKGRIILLLSQKNFYVNLEREFSKFLKQKILSHGIKNFNFDTRTKSFYHGIWQNRFNLADLVKVGDTFAITLDEIYDSIEAIYFGTGKKRGQNSLVMKLPSNFAEFFYLAGLFAGDGSFKKFIVGKEELASKLESICKGIGVKTTKVSYKNKTPEIHTSMTLVMVLNALFEYPLRQKSRNIKISRFLLESPKEYSSQFLRGYFDTDGCVEKSRSAVTISSASTKMIDDLHLFLLRFGCIAIREKDNTLAISGLSALNFQNEIGFGLREKANKLKSLVMKISGSRVCDSTAVGNQLMLIEKSLKDLNESGLAYVEVVKIESTFEEIVYDFTVPDNHNFIAEGMVIHNTALTDNLLAAAGHMASKNAGDLEEGMATWQHKDEQERLMTVDAANVSMVRTFDKSEYLINLIDTPGHVDFGGNVTRAMRAIDGTVVLICAVEGIMPQTETVLKQAIRERVKPVLFINKVDRKSTRLNSSHSDRSRMPSSA